MGPNLTLRNRDSVAGWSDDLTPRAGYSFPMPAAVNFTISGAVQPVIATNRLFIGTQEGTAHGINADDGATLWSTPMNGGTVASAAVSEDGSVVIFVTLTGMVYGLRPDTGAILWTFSAKKSITAAPCVLGTSVYIADHSGTVYALNTTGGAQRWSTTLPALVWGGIAASGSRLYVGAENVMMYALDTANGSVVAQRQLRGQSFRQQWPVVFNNIVWAQTNPTPIIGSEYIMETLMAGSASLTQEEDNIALWLQGNSQWADSGLDWKHLYALDAASLTEPYTILAGPQDGTGSPPESVVVDNSNRVLAYFKTRYPKLTAASAFGTAYSIDIAAINQTTGRRIPIDNGQLANIWPWETDNMYAMSVAGNYLWLRQNFRGTQVVNLTNSSSTPVQAQIRNWDGGNFSGFNIVYKDQPLPPDTNQPEWLGRVAPAIVGNRVYWTENYAVTAVEHKP